MRGCEAVVKQGQGWMWEWEQAQLVGWEQAPGWLHLQKPCCEQLLMVR